MSLNLNDAAMAGNVDEVLIRDLNKIPPAYIYN